MFTIAIFRYILDFTGLSGVGVLFRIKTNISLYYFYFSICPYDLTFSNS